jgi:hypothetical protein
MWQASNRNVPKDKREHSASPRTILQESADLTVDPAYSNVGNVEAGSTVEMAMADVSHGALPSDPEPVAGGYNHSRCSVQSSLPPTSSSRESLPSPAELKTSCSSHDRKIMRVSSATTPPEHSLAGTSVHCKGQTNVLTILLTKCPLRHCLRQKVGSSMHTLTIFTHSSASSPPKNLDDSTWPPTRTRSFVTPSVLSPTSVSLVRGPMSIVALELWTRSLRILIRRLIDSPPSSL